MFDIGFRQCHANGITQLENRLSAMIFKRIIPFLKMALPIIDHVGMDQSLRAVIQGDKYTEIGKSCDGRIKRFADKRCHVFRPFQIVGFTFRFYRSAFRHRRLLRRAP